MSAEIPEAQVALAELEEEAGAFAAARDRYRLVLEALERGRDRDDHLAEIANLPSSVFLDFLQHKCLDRLRRKLPA